MLPTVLCDVVPPSGNPVLTQLSFVRHGHVHNPENILYGRRPRFHLSQRGLRESRAVARALKERPLAAVYSSPLLRARQTAKQILVYHGDLKLHVSHLLTEVHTPFEGSPSDKVHALGGDIYTGSKPPFEQPLDIVTRVRKFSDRIRKNYRGRHVVAVTHGDIITFMLLWSRGMSLAPRFKRNLRVTGISDSYPATTSMTSFIYRTDSADEHPDILYTRSDNS